MRCSIAHALKQRLHQQGRLRVWSILVTIMGDIVETTGGEISIAALLDISTLLDIEPQAVRTAMSRLSKEGWVKRIPNGRTTKYRFSDARRGEFLDAAQYIYARPDDPITDWKVGILPPWSQAKKTSLLQDMALLHPIIINQQIAIWPGHSHDRLAAATAAHLTIFGTLPASFSEDALATITPSPQASLVIALCQIVEDVIAQDTLTPQDALVIRIVLIHFWRRLVLRHVHIQSPFSEDFWPLPKLHRLMAAAYPKLAAWSAPALHETAIPDIQNARFTRPAGPA